MVVELSGVLGSRASGEKTRQEILANLSERPCPVKLDFRKVELITQGWADEALAKLSPAQLKRVRVVGANSTCQAIIRYAVARRHNEEEE